MRFVMHRRDTRRRSGVCVSCACTLGAPYPLLPPSLRRNRSLFSSLLQVYPILSASPSCRAPGESERIPWPPGPRPTNTFSPPRSARALSQRPIVGGECRCAPRSRPVIVATRRRPYGRRRNARPGLHAPDRDPERVCLSLSLSLSYSTPRPPK